MKPIKKIAVLGCGNMGTAFSIGLSGAGQNFDFYTYTPSAAKAMDLAKKLRGQHFSFPKDLPDVDLVIIACKPQNISDLIESFGEKLKKSKYIISLLAGTRSSFLEEKIPGPVVIRIMPNTPAIIGNGLNLIYSSSLRPQDKEYFLNLLDYFSKNIYLDKEDDFDYLTGVSGSGPAYIFELIRILSLPFTNRGIHHDKAQEYASEIILGAVKLFKQSREDVVSLRTKVTSTGGVTAEALNVLAKKDLEGIFLEAIEAAYEKGKNLSQ